MAKKPTVKKKEVAVEATSSIKTSNGPVYTVRLGKNSKFGSRVNAKS